MTMEEGGELRRWEELIPDALALVFSNLSLQELLTVIPRVCKSWGKAVSGPYCWQVIDIEEWSNRSEPEQLDRMLQMLVNRSSGSLRRLCVSGLLSDRSFSFVAENAPFLQFLKVPRSEITDPVVEQMAGRLQNITFLDVSYCTKIGARALAAFGKHCKSLVELRRVMHPWESRHSVCRDDEAHAIATTMPKLRRLEMVYMLLTTGGILEILWNCKELEFLDMRGCWDVELDKNLMEEKFTKLKIMGPEPVDNLGRIYCSDYSYSSSSELAWELMGADGAVYYDDDSLYETWDEDDVSRHDELQLRIYDYEGFENSVSEVDWPPSP